MKRLDNQKAAAIIREAGLRADVAGGYAFGYDLGGDFVAVSPERVIGSIDGSGRSAEAMEALAARLLAMAAVCRRIEAEAITETPS